MKDMIYEDYQSLIGDQLLRHRSILDILTKYQEATSRVNRAVIKAVTGCGCIEIHAGKQELTGDVSLDNLKDYMSSHLSGQLCDHCRDIIEKEIGNQLFFIAGLANTLDISLYDIILQEEKKMSALGKYQLR